MRRSIWILSLLAAGCVGPSPSAVGQFDVRVLEPTHPGAPYSLLRSPDPGHSIWSFAISNDYLLFTSTSEGLFRLPKYGGKLEAIERDSEARYTDVAATAAEVFWTEIHGNLFDGLHTVLKRRAVAGGAATTLDSGDFVLGPELFVDTIALGGNSVYLTPEPTQVRKVAAGSATRQLTIPPVDGRYSVQPDWIADGDTLYFTDCRSVETRCALVRLDATTGAATTLMPLAAGDAVRAADETYLYFTSDRRVWRLAKADLGVTELYTTSRKVHPTLVVDASNVYFFTYDVSAANAFVPAAGQVVAVPKAGGAATVIGEGEELSRGLPLQMIEDQKNLFMLVWTLPTHQILMLPKTRAQ